MLFVFVAAVGRLPICGGASGSFVQERVLGKSFSTIIKPVKFRGSGLRVSRAVKIRLLHPNSVIWPQAVSQQISGGQPANALNSA